jgi:hypothetical protein
MTDGKRRPCSPSRTPFHWPPTHFFRAHWTTTIMDLALRLTRDLPPRKHPPCVGPATTTGPFVAPPPRLIRPGSALEDLSPPPARQDLCTHASGQRARLPRRPCCRESHARAIPSARITALRQPMPSPHVEDSEDRLALPSGMPQYLAAQLPPRGAWPRCTRRKRTSWPPSPAHGHYSTGRNLPQSKPPTHRKLPAVTLPCAPPAHTPTGEPGRNHPPHRAHGTTHHHPAHRTHGGRDPAALDPARPAVTVQIRPFAPQHRPQMAPRLLGATSRRGAQLGPALHVQTRRLPRLPLDHCRNL